MALRGTCVDASARKLHAVNKGYFQDAYVQCFTTDTTIMNSPLMNRGFWLRYQVVTRFIDEFLQAHDGQDVQIVQLGAGFDTTFFRLSEACHAPEQHPDSEEGQPTNAGMSLASGPSTRIVRYLELDQPDVVAEKRSIITARPQLEKHVHSRKAVYRSRGVDLRDAAALAAALQEELVGSTLPTLFVAEMVLVYLDPRHSDGVISACLKACPTNSFLTYEAIHPDDPFGRMMCENLSDRGCPLLGIKALKTVQDHEERFKALGYAHANGATMAAIYKGTPVAARRRMDQLEMVDEWEEWELVHHHYAIVAATATAAGGEAKAPTTRVVDLCNAAT